MKKRNTETVNKTEGHKKEESRRRERERERERGGGGGGKKADKRWEKRWIWERYK